MVWRAARAAHDAANVPGVAAGTKKELILEALRLIREAKALAPGVGAVCRWSGTILSAAGAFQGTTEYIKNAFFIRADWEDAVTINPNDASALHLLGRWHYDVATMSWLTRTAAATFFATPPSSTLADAVSHFERAEAISPGFWIANQLWLAKTHYAMGNKAEAVRWAASAVRIAVRTSDDATDHAEAAKLLTAWDAAAATAWADEKKAREAAVAKAASARVRTL